MSTTSPPPSSASSTGQRSGAWSSTRSAWDSAGGASLVVLGTPCFIDMLLGAALILRWRPRRLAVVQIAIVLLYTAGLTWARPALWADPFGPLLKNLPILVAIAILA